MSQGMLCFWAGFIEIFCVALYNTAAVFALYRPHLGWKTAAFLFWLVNFLLLFPSVLVADDPQRYVLVGVISGSLLTGASIYILWKYFYGSLWNKLIWLVLRDMLDPNLVSIIVFSRLFPWINLANLRPANESQLLIFIFMELISLLLRAVVINIFVCVKRRHTLSEQTEKILGNFCILFYAGTVIILFRKITGNELSSRADGLLPFIIFSLCVAVAVKIVLDTLDNRRLAREVAELSQQKQAQYDLFMERLARDEETRRLRHDLRGHITALETLLGNGEYARAQAYLAEVSRQQAALPAEPARMENAVAGALIADKYLACQKEGIALSVDGGIPSRIGISDVDLVCMLSNLLDNAIEACEQVEPPEDRRIAVKLTQRAGCLFIRVDNSKGGGSSLKNGRLIDTTKKNRSAHGLGGRIMRSIAERYGGTLEFQETEDNFTAIVMLCPAAAPDTVSQPQPQ